MITVYSKTDCPYCHLAKNWLTENKLDYKEVLLDDIDLRQKFYDTHNIKTRTVPQIYKDDQLIGGYRELLKSELAVKVDLNLGDF